MRRLVSLAVERGETPVRWTLRQAYVDRLTIETRALLGYPSPIPKVYLTVPIQLCEAGGPNRLVTSAGEYLLDTGRSAAPVKMSRETQST